MNVKPLETLILLYKGTAFVLGVLSLVCWVVGIGIDRADWPVFVGVGIFAAAFCGSFTFASKKSIGLRDSLIRNAKESGRPVVGSRAEASGVQ